MLCLYMYVRAMPNFYLQFSLETIIVRLENSVDQKEERKTLFQYSNKYKSSKDVILYDSHKQMFA
jgi:hypothetical protein